MLENAFAVAVIDENLCDESGYTLARFVKKNAGTRVIMLVDEAGTSVRMASYLAGAVACVERAHALKELPVLVANVLDVRSEINARKVGAGWRIVRQGSLLLGPGGLKVRLTPKEFLLIEALAKSSPESALRSQLLYLLGYEDDSRGAKALEAVVHRLRGKVDSAGGEELILTAHAIGWSLSAPVVVS